MLRLFYIDLYCRPDPASVQKPDLAFISAGLNGKAGWLFSFTDGLKSGADVDGTEIVSANYEKKNEGEHKISFLKKNDKIFGYNKKRMRFYCG